MSKAKITLNSNHAKKEGAWGFLLVDKQGNSYSFHYINGYLEVPDQIAKQFEGREDINIKYSDGSGYGVAAVAKAKSKPEPVKTKKHTKTQLKNMKSKEQVELLTKLGSKIFPRLEDKKIKLIMELEARG